MAAKVVKELYGFSGNQILLMQKHNKLFVRKIGNISRNIERMRALSVDYPLPQLYTISNKMIDMEYLHGLDIKTYLKTNNYEKLLDFILSILDKLSSNAVDKDYTETYIKKLQEVSFDEMPFTREQLLERLPKILPSSNYHGDLTLENIIFTADRGFFLIDCQTTEYDSHIFDLAKLRQDLECGWFVRQDSVMLDVKIKYIQNELLKIYPLANNNSLLILMLLRVYRYSQPHTKERNFLLDWINRLWKL
jgi:tRNA A-37 threonylcarbamoyl transferase component Bud32